MSWLKFVFDKNFIVKRRKRNGKEKGKKERIEQNYKYVVIAL